MSRGCRHRRIKPVAPDRPSRWQWAWAWLLLTLLWPALPGCLTQVAAERMLAAPNGGREAQDRIAYRYPMFFDGAGAVRVGPPEAVLLYGIMEPRPVQVWTTQDPQRLVTPRTEGQYLDVQVRLSGTAAEGQWTTILRFEEQAGHIKPPPGHEPRGTVVMLLGYGAGWREGAYLWPLACSLADRGYRVILPDLRGQGQSTGSNIGWTLQDAADLGQLLDELEDQDMLAGGVGMVGHSYGGAVAIQAAAMDRRVDAVLAIAPFASMRGWLSYGVQNHLREYHPLLHLTIGWLAHDGLLQSAATRAGDLAGFDPDAVDQRRAVQAMQTPVLLMHGDADVNVLPDDSQSIYAARPAGSELVIYRGEDHWSFLERRFDDVQQRSTGWFDRWLEEPHAKQEVRHAE